MSLSFPPSFLPRLQVTFITWARAEVSSSCKSWKSATCYGWKGSFHRKSKGNCNNSGGLRFANMTGSGHLASSSHLILEHSFVNVGLHSISLTEGADWSQKKEILEHPLLLLKQFHTSTEKKSNLKSSPMPVPQLTNEIKCRNRSF